MGRAVLGKSADHHSAARGESAVNGAEVGSTRLLVDKEVQDRAVVPHVPPSVGFPRGDVSADPSHGSLREPGSRDVERGLGEIENRDVGIPGGHKMIDKVRRAASDIEDRGTRRDPRAAKRARESVGCSWNHDTDSAPISR